MKTSLRIGIISLTLAGFAIAAENIAVKPVSLVETRVKAIDQKANRFGGEESSLLIKLHIEGDAVASASSFGKPKIAEATDDTGGSLMPKEDRFASLSEFQEIHRFGMDKEDKGFEVEIKLATPQRKATAIKSLKGELPVLAGGEQRVASLTNIKSHYGKAIDDPSLKAAKLQIRVLDPKSQRMSVGENRVPLEINGNASALKEVKILNAQGENITSGYFGTSMGEGTTNSYSISEPLTDTTKLELHVMVGQKAVTVPFDLKDVPLP